VDDRLALVREVRHRNPVADFGKIGRRLGPEQEPSRDFSRPLPRSRQDHILFAILDRDPGENKALAAERLDLGFPAVVPAEGAKRGDFGAAVGGVFFDQDGSSEFPFLAAEGQVCGETAVSFRIRMEAVGEERFVDRPVRPEERGARIGVADVEHSREPGETEIQKANPFLTLATGIDAEDEKIGRFLAGSNSSPEKLRPGENLLVGVQGQIVDADVQDHPLVLGENRYGAKDEREDPNSAVQHLISCPYLTFID
jgi:hypothetical protein